LKGNHSIINQFIYSFGCNSERIFLSNLCAPEMKGK
jgi:hypothetical protein